MSNQENPPSIVLPIIAICCVFCCFPLGIALSVVALIKHHNAKGSTALTLAIIALVMNIFLAVPLTGIYAAIAIPNFVKFSCRSKQVEAKTQLKSLHVMQESFKQAHGKYAASLDELQLSPPADDRAKYTYKILEASPTSFKAEARGQRDVDGDVWIIDESGTLLNAQNFCR